MQLPQKVEINKKDSIGIDLGIKDFAVLSTGEHIDNPHFIEEEEKHLAHLQKVLSRRDKGNWKKGVEPSKRFERQKIKVARLQRKIADQRRDFEHKLSRRIVDENGTICIEDLNVKGMMQNDRLAKNIASVSWAEFTNMLTYKCDWYGKNLIKADRWDASSQICSKCGYKNDKVKNLNVRRWVCPQCGAVHNRDENAANNIVNMAIKKIS